MEELCSYFILPILQDTLVLADDQEDDYSKQKCCNYNCYRPEYVHSSWHKSISQVAYEIEVQIQV